ncbi:MAG: peptide chain release factor N(5)-glutamine methyltransferase [Lachnospiraceae bacterium]|nr:peptide chain release factor N(5)-glutamine methyltransferase [Lachnospiraceae bacterium]
MTYQEILKEAENRLNKAGIEEYKANAWLLFSSIFKMDRLEFMMACLDYADDEGSESSFANLNEAIDKRIAGVPVQYISNEQSFYGYDFYVDERVLIPRQDTEIVVETIINTLQAYMLKNNLTKLNKLLDVCTGSGCIAITLANELPIDEVYASDVSSDALEVAAINGKRLNTNVKWILSDCFNNLGELKNSLDVIVSNPPYIETEVINSLEPDVKDHEPMLALDGSLDGLKFYRLITAEAKDYLKAGGYLFYEIGYNQGKAVYSIMKDNGFKDVQVAKDLAGLDRVCYGHL